MKKVLLAVCVMVLATGAVPAFAESKIALVNLREVLAKCEVGAKAGAELRAVFTPRQQKLAEMKQEALALQEQLKAKAPEKSPKSAELEAKVRKVNEDEALLRRDIAAEEETRLKPIIEKATATIRAYGQEKKLAGVQDRGSFLYFDPSLDITDEIIKRMNQAQ
ncbi:MAG: OmpH family outer membrane protein [Acidobacteriota bacterium]